MQARAGVRGLNCLEFERAALRSRVARYLSTRCATRTTHLLAAGAPSIDVSKRLGDVNPQVSATVYAHTRPVRDDRAVAAWEKPQKDSQTWKSLPCKEIGLETALPKGLPWFSAGRWGKPWVYKFTVL